MGPEISLPSPQNIPWALLGRFDHQQMWILNRDRRFFSFLVKGDRRQYRRHFPNIRYPDIIESTPTGNTPLSYHTYIQMQN